MFSGIVRALGEVVEFRGEEGATLTLQSPYLKEVKLGDSVSVSGVCLTVESVLGEGVARFDLSPESIRKTTLGRLTPGRRVNLEHPLRLTDFVHGHLVQGHVDGVATVTEVQREGESHRLELNTAPNLMRYVVPKGSIAVDGVSLTVGEVTESNFSVYIIPKTWEWTTLQELSPGGRVNLECDIIAKYLERLSACGK